MINIRIEKKRRMESHDNSELTSVLNSLYTSLALYLNVEEFMKLSSWFAERKDDIFGQQSAEENEAECLLTWITNDEEALAQFVETCSKVSSDSDALTRLFKLDDTGQLYYVKYLPSLMDASLIKKLSTSDMHNILNVLDQNRIIIKKCYQQAVGISDPYQCYIKMINGIPRGRSNWLHVFIDAMRKFRPDLFLPNDEMILQQNAIVQTRTEEYLSLTDKELISESSQTTAHTTELYLTQDSTFSMAELEHIPELMHAIPKFDHNQTSIHAMPEFDYNQTSMHAMSDFDRNQTSMHAMSDFDRNQTSMHAMPEFDYNQTSMHSFAEKDQNQTSSYTLAESDRNLTSTYTVAELNQTSNPTHTVATLVQEQEAAYIQTDAILKQTLTNTSSELQFNSTSDSREIIDNNYNCTSLSEVMNESNSAQADAKKVKEASHSEDEGLLADNKTELTGELVGCLDQLSDFTESFINEGIGDDNLYLTWAQFKSVFIQRWINSGNIDAASIVTYDYSDLGFSQEMEEIDRQEEPPELKLANFQLELAEKALRGENTIICAPTGSGKTYVAIYIILKHLQAQSHYTKKVVFLARTVALVSQQYKVLSKFLPKSIRVSSLTGSSKYQLQRDLVIAESDVIVMTPRILENHLIQTGPQKLETFSLIVFDECHHTQGEEPYNLLMLYYLKAKHQIVPLRNRVKLPQIVGLTATIGILNAKNEEEAIKNILQICGNLDVPDIACVELNLEELSQKVHTSSEDLVVLSDREGDEAAISIINKMKTLEIHMALLIRKINNPLLLDLLKKKPDNQKIIQFGNWAVKVGNAAKTLTRTDLSEMNELKRSLIILTDYLATYNVALEMLDLVLLRDVMEYLRLCFHQYSQNKGVGYDESFFFDSFSELEGKLERKLDSENPNLKLLKNKLLEYLINKGETSRGIIFVRSRALVTAITSWLNTSPDGRIQRLNAKAFIGTSTSTTRKGIAKMTLTEQNEVIKMFRNGRVRLLVATSVAEEGIDIPECNLVIRYNYAGNEITSLQTKGRSRTKGGVSVIMAKKNIIDQETLNRAKVEVMEKAIQQIRKMEKLERQTRIYQHQKNVLRERSSRHGRKATIRVHFKMVCHMCGKVVIDSKDVRTICEVHHVVIDSNIFKQTKTLAESKIKTVDNFGFIGPVHCMGKLSKGGTCDKKIGSAMIFSDIPFIVLGIKRFGFELMDRYGRVQKTQTFNIWKDVPYAIDEISPEDFTRYTESLSIFDNSNVNTSNSGSQITACSLGVESSPAVKNLMPGSSHVAYRAPKRSTGNLQGTGSSHTKLTEPKRPRQEAPVNLPDMSNASFQELTDAILAGAPTLASVFSSKPRGLQSKDSFPTLAISDKTEESSCTGSLHNEGDE